MELLFIWFLFGLISAVVASNKGRSGCGWFLLGFLLGPFGLILALVISKKVNYDRIEKPTHDRVAERECPRCQETIRADALKCKHCGRDLQTHSSQLIYCSNCGNKLGVNKNYCGYCGHKQK